MGLLIFAAIILLIEKGLEIVVETLSRWNETVAEIFAIGVPVAIVGLIIFAAAYGASPPKPLSEEQKRERAERQAAFETKKRTFFANIYVVAWDLYQESEKHIPRAWLFASEQFMKRLYTRSVREAWETVVENYQGVQFFDCVVHPDEPTTWVTWSPTFVQDPDQLVEELIKEMPCLSDAYDWELAELATGLYPRKKIPSRDDWRTEYSRRMAWSDKDHCWEVQMVARWEGN